MKPLNKIKFQFIMIIRTIIIDDEAPARRRIAEMLEDEAAFSIIGQCRNAEEGLHAIQFRRPDLVFLDVQMPGLNGYEMAEKLDKNSAPFIIFVTAYEDYALKAFNVQAVDYLLKPFTNQRFRQALNRVMVRVEEKKSLRLKEQMKRLVDDFSDNPHLSKLLIKHKGRLTEVLMDEVLWIEAQGNYIKLITLNENYLFRASMQEITSQLNERQFLRIHRSIIVNCFRLEKIKYTASNLEYGFYLANKEKLQSGRTYKEAIDGYLNKFPAIAGLVR